MGRGILFTETNQDWADRRKTISASFYKDKLLSMIDIMKDVTKDKFKEWHQRFIINKEEMDSLKELRLFQS